MSLKKKILVVDDEADVRFIVGGLLRSKGMEVETCATANECMRQVMRFKPEAVILDIDLPDGSGLDLIPRIKNMDPDTRVIMNSAYDSAENKEKAEELGSEAFLTKPISRSNLLEAIKV